ncbi:MAG: hypothetical protein WBN77_07705, partial [Desulfobacterales bacterium]
MRIQESEYRIQKKNNSMVILSPDSWLLYSHASLCLPRAWRLVEIRNIFKCIKELLVYQHSSDLVYI